MPSSRHPSRYGEGPMAQSSICLRRVRKQNLEYVRKPHRRLQSWCRRLDRAELRTDHRLYIREQPDSPDSSVYAPSKKPTQTTSIMEPLRDRHDTINVPKCPKQVLQPRHTHGREGPNHSWQSHWQCLTDGDIRKTCGTHQSTTLGVGSLSTEGSFTGGMHTAGQHYDAYLL